tara:strand:+ start:309 stop:494 length:186 start_codon:yes stop_codon:yes gene_type:complete
VAKPAAATAAATATATAKPGFTRTSAAEHFDVSERAESLEVLLARQDGSDAGDQGESGEFY